MPEGLFTRDEVLGGLPAGRANSLVFLIESRTAHLMALARRAMERFLTDQSARERDLAFLEAFALGRNPPLRPTIQNLEQYAPQWSSLVPDNPQLRAALAHVLGEKYDFTREAVPGIRAALGLDQEAVQRAYQRLYRHPVETIFASRTTLFGRLRWVWAAIARWLESLPPFWTVFALTLTETVGATILALPIAVAEVGPLAGVAFLILLGLINVLTIAYVADAVSRSGSFRYGNAFFGRLVAEYLGNAGSLILSLSLTLLCFVALLAYYIGVSTTLADATRVPAQVWAALLLLTGLYFVRARSYNATVASSLFVGMINIGLIVILSFLAFTRLRPDNVLYVNLPLLAGRPFEPSILRLIFGVILIAYFGHLSIGNCAKVVLQRDRSARSLTWGSVAAQVTAIALYSVWVLAVNGAVAPQALAGLPGTALAPLADRIGPSVHVLGSIYVVLGMGMASIHYSLSLCNLVREWLPTRLRRTLVLPRRRGSLHFQPRGGARGRPLLVLTYLGLEGGRSNFRLDIQAGTYTDRVEKTVADRWEITALLDRLPYADARGLSVTLEVLDASQEAVRLHVTSSMMLSYEGEWDVTGLRAADILMLADPLRQLVAWMMHRTEVSLAEVAAHTGQSTDAARGSMDMLESQGVVCKIGGESAPRYRPILAQKRGRPLPQHIWETLGQSGNARADTRRIPRWVRMRALVQRSQEVLLSEGGRFVLSVAPVAVLFLMVEWLFFVGAESFTEPLNFGGVIAASLIGGIFPVLLLTACGRKGEYVPATVFPFLAHPVLKVGIYVLFVVTLALYGLVIWTHPVERAAALIAGVLVVGATVAMMRRGAFAGRAVVELREELRAGGRSGFAVVAAGRPLAANVRLAYSDGEQQLEAAAGEIPTFSALRRATIELPEARVRDLKVWVHRVTLEGISEGLAAELEVRCGDETRQLDLGLSGGQVVLPYTGVPAQVVITFPEEGQA
jgi:hypothetical protein